MLLKPNSSDAAAILYRPLGLLYLRCQTTSRGSIKLLPPIGKPVYRRDYELLLAIQFYQYLSFTNTEVLPHRKKLTS